MSSMSQREYDDMIYAIKNEIICNEKYFIEIK